MLKYKGKEFRNLEEQVQKNLDDIQDLKTGIRIEKSITVAQLPTYTVESRLGQYFLVTDDGTKYLYLITLNNSDSVIAENLGEFPARGPQGIQGIQGPQGEPGESIRGPQGIQGEQGVRGRPGEGWNALDEIDATPYTPTFTEQADDVKVETSANIVTNADTPDEETKVISLKFKVPKSTPVIANPAETGETDLTKLKIGDTVYNISSGVSGLYKHNLTIIVNSIAYSLDNILLTNNGLINTVDKLKDFISGNYGSGYFLHANDNSVGGFVTVIGTTGPVGLVITYVLSDNTLGYLQILYENIAAVNDVCIQI